MKADNQSEARIACLRKVTTVITVESGTSKSGGRGHSSILYTQLNQHDREQDSDTDEEALDQRKVVRELPSRSIMELNIYNRKLFLGSLLAVEVFGIDYLFTVYTI